jgi:zinc finger protein BrlA
MLSGFQDPTMIFSPVGKLLSCQGMIVDNNFPNYNFSFSNFTGPNGDIFSNDSSTSLESQSVDEDLFSPISNFRQSQAEDFVIPSQTTFMESFEMDSPLRTVKSFQLNIQYGTPMSENDSSFDLGSSLPQSMKYFVSPSNESDSYSATPPRPASLRQQIPELIQTSVALHHVQEEQTDSDKQAQDKRQTHKRAKRDTKGSLFPDYIKYQQPAKRQCPWQGCPKKFQRQEHLKRHLRIHTKKDFFPCEICLHPFGRSDNLWTHLKLHTNPSKPSKRTSYDPRAIGLLEKMNSQKQSRKSNGAKKGQEAAKKLSRVTGF